MTQPNNMMIRFWLDETDDSGKQQVVKGKGRKNETLGGSLDTSRHGAELFSAWTLRTCNWND